MAVTSIRSLEERRVWIEALWNELIRRLPLLRIVMHSISENTEYIVLLDSDSVAQLNILWERLLSRVTNGSLNSISLEETLANVVKAISKFIVERRAFDIGANLLKPFVNFCHQLGTNFGIYIEVTQQVICGDLNSFCPSKKDRNNLIDGFFIIISKQRILEKNAE